MKNMRDPEACPTLEEFSDYINNPVFMRFCLEMKERYCCKERAEFSSCSWEPGWNIKFRKSGKNLCTIYPREGFFTVLVVIGKREQAAAEELLPECTQELKDIYRQTKAGNGQKWLMIDLEDEEELYHDIFRLIELRRG